MESERPAKAADVLTETQRVVANRVIDEESRQRQHVVVYLSGAHAYGFPSPDSDLDLKAIHLEKTNGLLGLHPPRTTFDRAGFVDGIEIDYTSNELGAALAGMLLGNGNFLERALGVCTFRSSLFHEELAAMATHTLSRRVHRHYRGFAASQLRALEETPTVKKMLYVLRTTLTGTHLLRSGNLVTDVTELLDEYGYSRAHELIVAKRRGERTPLDQAMHDEWKTELARAFDLLDDAERRSPLPPEPTGERAVEAWLVALRRRY